MRLSLIFFIGLAAVGCSTSPANNTPSASPSPKRAALPVYGYEIVHTYPHDGNAFTQGLFYHDGFLYESTGQEGESSIRRVDLATGKVVQKWDLPPEDFGEGATLIGDKIYSIIWRGGLGRVLDAKTFKVVKEFSYLGEGWGLTTDGTSLYMSQGTHVLKIIDPATLKQTQTIPVMRDDGRPLMKLNELEWVKGELWANVWHSEEPDVLGKPNTIARIDASTGKLLGWIDLAGISPNDQGKPGQEENTLNGIAYDAATERIFVTGKNWKNLYEIKLTAPKN